MQSKLYIYHDRESIQLVPVKKNGSRSFKKLLAVYLRSHNKQIDNTLKEKILNPKYKIAFFHVLLNYYDI
jgi:hypothetical protein